MVEYFLKIKPQENPTLKKKTSPEQKTNNTQKITPEKSEDHKASNNINKPTPKKNTSDNNSPDKKNETTGANNFNLDIKTLLDNWSNILVEIKKHNQSILALLQNCAPMKIDGVTTLIKTKYPFHKDKLNEMENKLTIEKVFAKILKVPLKVKFITEDELPESAKETESKAEKTDGSDLLYEAMKKIGGKLVEK